MEAITFYEPIVSKCYEDILEISAIVLGNLCVSYILTMQNDKAEDIMGLIESREDELAQQDPDRKVRMVNGPLNAWRHVYPVYASVAMFTSFHYVAISDVPLPWSLWLQVYHHCIVNLVIGTLYCAKGNFEFGITRVIKCAEPVHKKLGTQTWQYIRNCFCALLEGMAKQMVNLKDDVADEIIDFLEVCETIVATKPKVVLEEGKH